MSERDQTGVKTTDQWIAEHTRWLLKGDPLEVALGLLLRAKTFLPDGSATRADVSIFLDRMDER